jgi:ribosome-binding factor A
MPREFSRARRVAEQLQRELADLIHRELKDPRVGLVTITAVELSKDLAYAKVLVSSLGEGQPHAELVSTLQHAAGFLRHELGGRMRLRIIPELRFVYDESLERAAKLEALIARANAAPGDGKDQS